MTETMRRLGRVYAERVHDARCHGLNWEIRVRKIARAGLDALALRSVLRGMMAEARARCGFCGEVGGVDRGSLCPGCRRGLERTNFD